HIDLDVLKADKDSWIIKPEDGYGSKGVVAGRDQSAEDWAKALDRAADTVYLVQSFAPQYPMPNTRIIPVDESYKLLYSSPETAAAYLNMHPEQGANALSSLEEWNSLTGLYLYNGRFAGTFIRAGQSGIIAGFAGGITLPTLLADYDPHAGLAIRTREFS
ncbi:MAG: hypothetical protein LBS98_07010, partial [Coriobacteriales bacterium]|nr:hypothetical protein [Coriobacteriales bacterium]